MGKKISILALLLYFTTATGHAGDELRLLVFADIHVYPASNKVHSDFNRVVKKALKLKPDAVILAGDSTGGNKDDTYSLKKAKSWWVTVKKALKPFKDAGIPVLPVAGNHDYYREVHKQAYREAWANLADEIAPLKPEGNPPLYYSVRMGTTHLSLLHIVDQKLEEEVGTWLKKDLEKTQEAPPEGLQEPNLPLLRFAFGHYPLASVMAPKKTNEPFKKELGEILIKGGVSVYFSGHEHLVWDESIKIGKGSIRQVICGTASGAYEHEVGEEVAKRYCENRVCTMPEGDRVSYLVDGTPDQPGERYQKETPAFVAIDVVKDSYSVTPYWLSPDGELLEFDRKKEDGT